MALSFRLNENTGHGGDRLHLIILPKLAKHGAGAPPDFQHTRLSMARQSTRAAQILQYLRSARALACHAEARVLKVGRRTSTVFCQLWQDDEMKPVTSMAGVFIQPKT